ncbi:hypothetical protein [Noviherbaspirillum cavernae]|uniref:hypothetical protein n=1 Tax=Noviherbaspirillum cavernae TaxID=2320862 RepID=UPI0011C42564|nr:hypothetical protein [Noviherbaspirillum cavernae]
MAVLSSFTSRVEWNLDIAKMNFLTQMAILITGGAGFGNRIYERLEFVKERPRLDHCYAIDPGKLERELAWKASEPFELDIRTSVSSYLDNQEWVLDVMTRICRNRTNRYCGA